MIQKKVYREQTCPKKKKAKADRSKNHGGGQARLGFSQRNFALNMNDHLNDYFQCYVILFEAMFRR